ncbi:acetyl-CoA carboxylase biotin carboxyl carrier protein [Brevibacillus invocatus]|uniref:Biotin carboxyl carrier protein of acetyl-CoA carboxylase n=1 Tax=Brevibacillus invocatus TaxID=173959 RepID=A0A3M8CHS7_9BACL|nr:acetyl-CoA carboxylase biotin carboxyl carrier protein [Brevibacillus invocatus]MCM3081349.1 acetyl-CoA carboxylase biotin carboxyl carrier protein [Brevibacillus invocatus]MCM3431663.1 acetyl-CoA carboxylase biotin carboxyl carrier protein [Brevibacillus invocatus]RNB75199.1 acetyl-CoA carboxylase biotin carboxyl carrier protein [Brevibacillus invocatus]
MLTIYEIRELVKLLEQTDIESVEVKDEQSRIAIKRSVHGTVPVVVAKPTVVAPIVNEPEKLVVVKEAPKPAVSAEPKVEPAKIDVNTENLHKITSPMVGTFYAAPAVDSPPYVIVGDKIHNTSIVCIVEAMKLFNEIEAEVKGEIVQILVENGQLVEQGQPLFLVKID